MFLYNSLTFEILEDGRDGRNGWYMRFRNENCKRYFEMYRVVYFRCRCRRLLCQCIIERRIGDDKLTGTFL